MWLLRLPCPMKTRKRRRAMLVSTIAARLPNAKLWMAPTVYSPIPLNVRRVSVSEGNAPLCLAMTSRAMAWSRRGRSLYPSGNHFRTASPTGTSASAWNDGNRSSHSLYFGKTRSTWVCWSITSDTRIRYGSFVFRHGSSRPLRAYQPSRRRRNRRRLVELGIGSADECVEVRGTV